MSVGALKKLLFLANLLAILGLGGTAYGFWSHREFLRSEHTWPDFAFTPAKIADEVGQIEHINMVLGRFPVKSETVEQKEPEPEIEELEGALAKVGKITGAIAIPDTADPDSPMASAAGTRPAIIFTKKDNSIWTLAKGEALENGPHPIYGDSFPVPKHYMFIGCERDKDNPKLIRFVFDMKCDGTDIQSVVWSVEDQVEPLKKGGPLAVGGEVINEQGKGYVVVSEKEKSRLEQELLDRAKKAAEEKAHADAEAKKSQKIEAVPTVEPDQVLPTVGGEGVPDDLYRDEDGVWTPTEEGSRYLEDNWQSIVEEARTSTYVDPVTRQAEGVLIGRIPSGSVAGKFGIYPDDVIKTVNARAVRSKSDAINVVKDEIENKNRRKIEVGILRNGKLIKKVYDTRDPATRRAARELR